MRETLGTTPQGPTRQPTLRQAVALLAAGPSPWVTCQVFANISFKPKVLPGFPQAQLSPSFPDFFLLDYGICKSPLVLLPPNQAPDLFPAALVSRHLLFLEVN